jgi:amino-acid N-acetyltransferase
MHSFHQPSHSPIVRRAQYSDVTSIFGLIESMTADGTLLRRPLHEIEKQLDTFIVADSHKGEFLGCAALHRYGAHLAEVRSIAVRPEARGLGAGGLLLGRLLDDIETTGTHCACLFTRIPDFFAHYGFHTVPLAVFADKIVKDCIRCPRRHRCDEIAMAWGELPPDLPGALVGAAGHLVQLRRA